MFVHPCYSSATFNKIEFSTPQASVEQTLKDGEESLLKICKSFKPRLVHIDDCVKLVAVFQQFVLCHLENEEIVVEVR